MNLKKLLTIVILFTTIVVAAQDKTFAFSKIQTRDSDQQWGEKESVKSQSVTFSPENINVDIDKSYHLTILSKTHLPDKGIIYLCEDELANPITVMLVSNVKMYLYSKTKRFLINFDAKDKG